MKSWILLALLAASAPALAHPGHGVESFHSGLLHPLTGADHLLMLLSAGSLAALTGRALSLPFATLLLMFGGAVGGHFLGAFSGMEMVIASSLAVAGGALLLTGLQPRLAPLLPLLALAHGWAHGAEMQQHAFWSFSAGFLLGSAALLAVGYGVGQALRRYERVRRLCGAGLLSAAAVLAS